MSSSSISSALAPGFTGVSKFASSLQSVLGRAISIASLPLNSLNAGLNNLGNKQAALQALETPFLSLQLSISSLENTVKSGILNSSVSDAGIVTASLQPGALTGSYSIEVQDLGSYSTAVSIEGSTTVSDPAVQSISSSSGLTLRVGTSAVAITAPGTSLQSLAAAINSQASDKVQATLINVGSTSAPDYRLSLQALQLSSDSISLTDETGELIGNSTAGTSANYKVGGLAASITSNSRTVTLAPGLTVNLTGQSPSGEPVTINVVHNPSALASALNTFAGAYNRAVDAIAQQHGKDGGALQGDSLLQTLSRGLSQLGTFSDGSTSGALANYGVTVDQSGHLSVDSNAFAATANGDFGGLLKTIGRSGTSGFLKTATDLLAAVEDPIHGLIKGEAGTVADAIAAQQKRISSEEDTVNVLQSNLTEQIAKADAAIAALESRVSYVTSLFAVYNGTSSSNSSSGL